MTVVPFPILRLPERAFQKCLKRMNPVEHLSLSVLSGNISKRIEMLHKNLPYTSIHLRPSIALNLLPHFSQELDFDFKPDQMKFKVNNNANGDFEFTEQKVPGFTLKQWFEQAVRVFIQNKQIHLYCSPESSIKEIYEHIKELRITKLTVESSEIRDCQLLKLFPALEKLSAFNGTVCKSILTQNFDNLRLKLTKVTLDDILASNTSGFSTDQNFTDKELNIFMKQWVRGSNHRLQSFHFHTWVFEPDQFVEAQLFKGIEYKKICSTAGRSYIEIERNDGTKANVFFHKTIYILFNFYVK